ncbi:hypothetical protein HDZ31DRAFT_50958, partial [Schizophyllum fasciatum]
MPGRATRGYPAWDPVTKAIVFIKDSWRSDTGDLLKEADVLRTLNAQNVEHAPTLICGGDLPGQRSVAGDCVQAEWNKGLRKKHHPRVHHRFAINFGQPLWQFRSTKHLLQILHDAFTCGFSAYDLARDLYPDTAAGHWQAVERCRKLHRDLSAWNIFWDEESGRGFLADRDLCAPMPPKGASDTDPPVNMMAEVPPASGRPERTGTWMFMYTRSLQTASQLHDIQDDLEALFWVAVYMTILFSPFPEANACHIVDDVLMKHTFVGGVAYGGAAKADFLVDPSNELYKIELSDCPVISAWLRGYRRLLHKWVDYHMQKVEDGDDDDAFPAFLPPTDAQAPPFDYATLDQAWVGMMENGERKGLFREGDRCDDEAHQLHPFEVTALYRDRVAQEEEEEEKEEEEAGAVYVPAQQSSTNPQDDDTSRAPSAVHLDAATSQGDTNAGPTPDSAANDTDDEGARRGAKRQR